jgi:hypothetical protein
MPAVTCRKCGKPFAYGITYPSGWVPLCVPCARPS